MTKLLIIVTLALKWQREKQRIRSFYYFSLAFLQGNGEFFILYLNFKHLRLSNSWQFFLFNFSNIKCELCVFFSFLTFSLYNAAKMHKEGKKSVDYAEKNCLHFGRSLESNKIHFNGRHYHLWRFYFFLQSCYQKLRAAKNKKKYSTSL